MPNEVEIEKYIKELEKENERLNAIIDELEKWLKEDIGNKYSKDYLLFKINELKEKYK